MSIDSGQHIHRNASAFRVLFRRECRDAYEISNCSDLEKSRSRNLKDCVQHGAWGIDSTSRKTIRSVKAEWMVFHICNTNALLATTISVSSLPKCLAYLPLDYSAIFSIIKKKGEKT